MTYYKYVKSLNSGKKKKNCETKEKNMNKGNIWYQGWGEPLPSYLLFNTGNIFHIL